MIDMYDELMRETSRWDEIEPDQDPDDGYDWDADLREETILDEFDEDEEWNY